MTPTFTVLSIQTSLHKKKYACFKHTMHRPCNQRETLQSLTPSRLTFKGEQNIWTCFMRSLFKGKQIIEMRNKTRITRARANPLYLGYVHFNTGGERRRKKHCLCHLCNIDFFGCGRRWWHLYHCAFSFSSHCYVCTSELTSQPRGANCSFKVLRVPFHIFYDYRCRAWNSDIQPS